VGREFRTNIRRYNNALSFTSLGADIDNSVNGPYGINTFRIHGALHHNILGLLPDDGQKAGFSQVYVTGDGGHEEVIERATRRSNRTDTKVDSVDAPVRPQIRPLNTTIIERFMKFFYEVNPFAHMFKYAGSIIATNPDIAMKLRSMDVHDRDTRWYNFPTADEVAVIVEGDELVGENTRDIILYRQEGGLKQISDLHTSYPALRYPILLPYRTQGFDEHYRQPGVWSKSFVNNDTTNL
jgi:hypothetical protein